MIENTHNNENWETLKIILGIISGIFISTIGFLFTHRFNWRNYLTQEFKVILKIDLTQVSGGVEDIAEKIAFNYEINCTNSEEMSINYIYFKIPENIKGNVPQNPTLGERIYGKKGRFYVQNEKMNFKHNHCGKYTLEDEILLNEIKNRNINYVSFIINTNKYGDIESNEVKISS
ncbi:hypothetical protein [Flavobacterium salmonis]|uniref:Uncharacterized protein n=1 Tax=Flavobacterium salmonis TaxID=2654844 RepID=A0A6V6Z221_9FLAO|nr:hypothetical protein [Flavobacterium salmonis]CAD0005599.1 hypothetical protein FLAT13_02869 [Flavobacterium salmonis]